MTQFAHLHPILPVGLAAPGCLRMGLRRRARRCSGLPLAPGSMAKPRDLDPQWQKSGCHRRGDLLAVPSADPAPAPPSRQYHICPPTSPRGTPPAPERHPPTRGGLCRSPSQPRGQAASTAVLCPARAVEPAHRAITYSHTGGATMGGPAVEEWGGGSRTGTLAVQPLLLPF